MIKIKREIPYNYTSADDDQLIRHLFGPQMLKELDTLRLKRLTGRSARLLFRFMGDMFMIERNPFIFQELLDHSTRRGRFLKDIEKDLDIIEKGAQDEAVHGVIRQCRKFLNTISNRIRTTSTWHRRIIKNLSPIVGKENIYFDPFTLTAHSTDATDWRLYPPTAVIRPCWESQVPGLVSAIKEMGLSIIPRGGGTGLTGGSVPLTRTCVMINTEKLNRIKGIDHRRTADGRTFACLEVEAGVITEQAMTFAKDQDLVFATDPTSSWASTIGGNIAENAGGKTAVLWGTALDNLISYNIVMPGGELLTVQRKDHPLRKIHAHDQVVFEIFKPDPRQHHVDDSQGMHRNGDRNQVHGPDDQVHKGNVKENHQTFHGELLDEIVLTGEEIRKKGLGKDVTNKTLNGLPGIQKEGCDGIITSAVFLLYPEYPFKQTWCMEFFGNDMTEAGRVISEISTTFTDQNSQAVPMALEHFDEEYIKAIDYKTKSSGSGRLKAVLMLDMVSNEKRLIDQAQHDLEAILAKYQSTCLTPARDEKEAQRFWRDRKRLGAIARRTNAFKLNEDIVLPIASLADFADYIDRYNLEEKRFNQHTMVENLMEYLETAEPLEDPEWLVAKVNHARTMAGAAMEKITTSTREELEKEHHVEEFHTGLLEQLRGYSRLCENIKKIHQETRSRLIVIATHMHAGDGNVHVNIPVLSNDREMMKRAAETADHIMAKAVALNGVVSGEHGIGVTKFKHLSQERIEEFERYRDRVDPTRMMNPGKLCDKWAVEHIYTPSFNLLELEANILRHGSLGTLAARIANCVRCGKCKVVCPVFYPKNNLFFHPRNKNLGVGALVEALLYSTQRTRSTEFRALKYLEEIADHCTICHKCLLQCPVNIDTGEVSIIERELLNEKKFKHTALTTRMTLNYLGTQNEYKNAAMRQLIVHWGGTFQRTLSRLLSRIPQPSYLGEQLKPLKDLKSLELLKSPVPKASQKTLRDILPKCHANQVILAEPEQTAQHTVFYFPGCGSERLHSDIGMASLYLLLKKRTRVILPPPWLCCGFPVRVNAKTHQFSSMALRDTIIFTQIKEMFSDLEFNACIISCGTCAESLESLNAQEIFNCEITDISRFILSRPHMDKKALSDTITPAENSIALKLKGRYLYHAPCHDSLKGEAVALLKERAGADRITPLPHCCSEAGTLAISRPDISNAMLERKHGVISRHLMEAGHHHDSSSETNADGATSPCSAPVIQDGLMPVLTNCPSCLQGLGRNSTLAITPRHIAVALAEAMGGTGWKTELTSLLEQSSVITF